MNSSSGLISNRRFYFNIQLSPATTLESFKQEFPNPELENFSDLVNDLIIKLSRDIKELESDLNQEDLAILNEDETNQPIPGATVLVQNSTRGVVTDELGKFETKVGG